jgi:hypothetical protein
MVLPRWSLWLVLLTPWTIRQTFVWLEIAFFGHNRKRTAGVLHGPPVEDIAKAPQEAVFSWPRSTALADPVRR